MNICSIGSVLEGGCDKKVFHSQKQKLTSVDDLNYEEQELLRMRVAAECDINTSTDLATTGTVCTFHKYKFLDHYSASYKSCCDVFKVHKRPIKNPSLRVISYDWYIKNEHHASSFNVIPGRKLCSNCRKKLESRLPDDPESSVSSDSEMEEIQLQIEADSSLSSLNQSLNAVGESPVKLHGISRNRRIAYGKRKIQKLSLNVKAKLAKVLKVDEIPEDVETDKVENENEAALESIISKIKVKIDNPYSTRAQKVQVLTMAPGNWSRKKISEFFGVSERLARDAKEQEKENGVCSLPPPRKGKTLSEETIQKVVKFFENGEHSTMLPGIKDRVIVKMNVYQQKRLLLCTVTELYTLFKQQNPDVKIGLSKFCELRPKYCVSAGRSKTHVVTESKDETLLDISTPLEE